MNEKINKSSIVIIIGYTLFLNLFFQACGQNYHSDGSDQHDSLTIIADRSGKFDVYGKTVESRILTPPGFQRIAEKENSFGYYLRYLPLKPHESEVYKYNGEVKKNHGIYVAVVDLNIGNKDLHQCADAVIRLRAEYLFFQKRYNDIHFNFTNGFRVDYEEWIKGKRVVVEGNKTYWKQSADKSNTYESFWNYLEVIFSYAGTLSLSRELKSAELSDIMIGDVFIQGGSPGHAVIVIDMAVNPTSGEKIFLLAQSYMPAQEIQILSNPENKKMSPWYSAENSDIIYTPEWTFYPKNLKRFE